MGTLYSSLAGSILNYGRSHLSPSSMNQAPTAASELLEVPLSNVADVARIGAITIPLQSYSR
jgi:hypothetical protein